MKNSKVELRGRRETQLGRLGSPSTPDAISMTGPTGEKSFRKKTTRKGSVTRSLQKKIIDASKSNRLVCRYCGS